MGGRCGLQQKLLLTDRLLLMGKLARGEMGVLAEGAAGLQVVEVLTDALSLPETPVPLKVARLLLASDILHNSTAPVRNASRYRSLLEAALPDIFESLQVRHL